jgi:hypothetical protein
LMEMSINPIHSMVKFLIMKKCGSLRKFRIIFFRLGIKLL